MRVFLSSRQQLMQQLDQLGERAAFSEWRGRGVRRARMGKCEGKCGRGRAEQRETRPRSGSGAELLRRHGTRAKKGRAKKPDPHKPRLIDTLCVSTPKGRRGPPSLERRAGELFSRRRRARARGCRDGIREEFEVPSPPTPCGMQWRICACATFVPRWAVMEGWDGMDWRARERARLSARGTVRRGRDGSTARPSYKRRHPCLKVWGCSPH